MKFFIECTQTYDTKFNSGIQRVVRSIVRSAMAPENAQQAIPVIFDSGKFVGLKTAIPFPDDQQAVAGLTATLSGPAKTTVKSRLHALTAILARAIPAPAFVRFLYAPRNQFGLAGIVYFPSQLRKWVRGEKVPNLHADVTLEHGDVLVLLDSSWNTSMWDTVDACRRRGVFVVVVIYDLIPLLHPRFCTPSVVHAFTGWLGKAVMRADALIGISHTIAIDIQRDLGRFLDMPQPLPRISYFWLGSELDGDCGDQQRVGPDLLAVCASERPTYVYVSTIEPRKNHGYALAAFDALWRSGVAANFVIVGRIGWHCADFVREVHGHEQYGKQLFMFNNVDDNGLAHIYATVRGLIFTSFAEGFGLPVIEGLQRGLPVFASDIAVFREIGQSGVHFVDLADPASLADALATHIRTGAQRLAEPVAWLTWQQSLQQLQARIGECIAAQHSCAGEIVHRAASPSDMLIADTSAIPTPLLQN